MSQLFVDNIKNRTGGAIGAPSGAVVTGVVTATTFSGNVIGDVTGNVNNSSNLLLKVDGGEKGRINSSGNFGVGHASPTARLDVRRADADGLIAELHQSTGYGIDIGSSQADAYISSGYNQNFIFKTNAGSGQVERLRIGSAGQLGLSGANYGTSGQVMTSQGASAAPQWASVSAGLWSTLVSGTVTSGTTGTITDNGITSTYHMYKIVFYGVMNGQGILGIDITTNGGTSWTGGGNQWTYCFSGREHNQTLANDVSNAPTGYLANLNRDQWWGEITFGDTQNSSTHPSFNFVGGFHLDSTIWGGTITTNMTYPVDTAFNGIRWYSSIAMSNVKWALLGSTLS